MLGALHTCLLVAVLAAAPPAAGGPAAPVITPVEAGSTIHLAIDYSEHPTFTAAVFRSLAPVDLAANARAVAYNTINPLTPLRYVTSLMVLEAQRQIASTGKVDVGALLTSLQPVPLATGYVGAQMGEMTGAVAQSLICEAFGPVGGSVGFLLRPVLWYLGSSIGQQIGLNWGQGGHPISSGVATALRDFNPTRDSLQMIGDSLGGVIGQALIPIPVVGAIAGGIVGGLAGLVGGQALLATGPGQCVNGSIHGALTRAADTVDGGPSPPPPIPPSISGSETSVGPSAARQAADSAYGRLIGSARSQDTAGMKAALADYRSALAIVHTADR